MANFQVDIGYGLMLKQTIVNAAISKKDGESIIRHLATYAYTKEERLVATMDSLRPKAEVLAGRFLVIIFIYTTYNLQS